MARDLDGSVGLGRRHDTSLANAPTHARRDTISPEEIAFAEEKRRSVRASWGAIARMLGRCEADVRAACDAVG